MSRDVWIFLFILGAVLFGWPVITIFDYGLSLYLFIIWIVFISLVFLSSFTGDKGNGGR